MLLHKNNLSRKALHTKVRGKKTLPSQVGEKHSIHKWSLLYGSILIVVQLQSTPNFKIFMCTHSGFGSTHQPRKMDISYRKELFHTIPNKSPKVHVLVFVCWKNCVLFGIVRWINPLLFHIIQTFWFKGKKDKRSMVYNLKRKNS